MCDGELSAENGNRKWSFPLVFDWAIRRYVRGGRPIMTGECAWGSSAEEMSKGVSLHLCCGDVALPEPWINCDIRDTDAADVVIDCGTLPDVPEESAKIIYCCHGLDHWSRHEYMDVLRRWYAILKPGGILRLSVVNFEEVVSIYREKWNLRELIGLLVARQDYPSNVRKMHWDYQTLSEDLTAVGFTTIRPWAWRSTDHAHIDDCSQAYLPHMDKDRGRHVSLNVEGVK